VHGPGSAAQLDLSSSVVRARRHQASLQQPPCCHTHLLSDMADRRALPRAPPLLPEMPPWEAAALTGAPGAAAAAAAASITGMLNSLVSLLPANTRVGCM